jgi:hypothetical protein
MPAPREAINLDDGYNPADYDENDDHTVEYDRAIDDRDERGHYDDERHGKPRVARPRELNPPRRSRIPAHAPRPQDHKRSKKKKTAAQREAEGIETTDVEFDGEVYTIPADPLDWDVEVTEAFEQGKVVTAVRGMLGPKQWRTVAAKGYTNRQFSKLFDLIARAGGFKNAGN